MRPAILVTGAFGYVGAALVRALGERPVIAFGHVPRNEQVEERFEPHVARVYGDLLEVSRALGSFEAIDAVFHLAGGGGPAKCAADPGAAIRANIRGTSELAAWAKARGISRLVYASTIAVYGTYRDQRRPYSEGDQPAPDDIYGVIKEAAEHSWTAVAGGTSLRLANVYGAGAGIDMGINGAVERFARAAASGGTIKIFGDGSQCIDYVHVDDVCAAFLATLERDELPPVLNIGGASPISIAEMADVASRVGAELGTPPIVERLAPPEGKSWPDRSLAVDRARDILGWRPRRSFEEGFRDLTEMMRTARKA